MKPKLIIAIGIFCSVILSLVFFFSTHQLSFSKALYSPNLTYRYQTNAFFEGKLSLFENIDLVPYDYVYMHGEAQQIWGLGVPVLRMPFELLLKGLFPDKITLAFYFALAGFCLFGFLVWYLQRNTRKFPLWLITLSSVVILFCILFMLPLVSLARTRFVVYEEAIFYGAIVSFILFGLGSRIKNQYAAIALSFAAGCTGFIRPTILAYGFATLCLILWNQRKNKKVFAGCVAVFLIGIALLGYTNYLRFGLPQEFGHGINIDSDPLNNHQLKFENLYAKAPIASAAKELIGGIFFTKPRLDRSAFWPNMVSFQAPYIRWRAFYSYAFTPVYFLLVIMSFATLCWYAIHQLRFSKEKEFLFSKDTVAMLGWGAGSFVLLFGFYLHAPSISSRYMIDFVGAVGIMSLAFVLEAYQQISKLDATRIRYSLIAALLGVCVGYTAFSLHTEFSRPNLVSPNITRAQAFSFLYKDERQNKPIGYSYALGRNFQQYGFFNGSGWDYKTGYASSTILIFIDHVSSNINLTFNGTCNKITDTSLEMKIGNNYVTPTVVHIASTTNALFEINTAFQGETLWPVYFKLFTPVTPNDNETGCMLERIVW